MPVTESLTHFVERYVKTYPVLNISYDAHWRSPCEYGEPFAQPVENGEDDPQQFIRWQPVKRSLADDFTGLEKALDTEIHTDIKAYFGAYWSSSLEAEAPDGHVSLIQLWNPQDVDRLVENLIGHSLAQRRSKSPLSLFFACTEPDSELFLTIRNDSGEIQLEKPGYQPIRPVAASLAQFLDLLVPNIPS